MSDVVPGQQQVVLVEDDGSMRHAIGRILSGSGYVVTTFESAEALQERLAGAPLWATCRCVVCDVRLPGSSGFDLHRQLASRAGAAWIFITAQDEPSVRQQAESSGAAYLLKPFSGRTLLALVERAVRAGRPTIEPVR